MRFRKPKPISRLQRGIPFEVVSGLTTAADLLAKKKISEAIDLLEGLHARFPRVQEPLMALVDAYQEADDSLNLVRVMTKLHELRPDDPELTLALGGMYLLEDRPALALSTFNEFLRRWPEHPDAPEVRKSIASLQEDLTPFLIELDLLEENPAEEEVDASRLAEALEIAVLHERLQLCLADGRVAEARRLAEQALRKRPEFPASQNNLSLIQFAEGDLPGAVATSRRVLQSHPDNYHALANQVRYLCQLGLFEEAKSSAARLSEIREGGDDLWIKKAEAFTFLGDDAQVLATLADAKKAGDYAEPGLLYHLAAVAVMRQGEVNQARRHWRQALKLAPNLVQAAENLEDLKNPVGERHAPWAFDIDNWIPPQTLRRLAESVQKAARRARCDTAVRHGLEHAAREHPELERLVPALFERGGPNGRTLAFHLAVGLDTPFLREALQDFALSQRGPDALRMEAARQARDAGLISATVPVRLWLDGEWRELLLLEFDVHEEADASRHSEEVTTLAGEALDALHDNRPADGEALLRRALELEPDSPDLLNNLASAYALQGRHEESRRLVEEIHKRFPDYLFARTNLAIHAVRDGNLERARELLEPVLKQGRYHVSEFSALCQAQLELQTADGKLDAAMQWLELWESLAGDHPQQAYWEQRLALEGLASLSSQPRKRRKRAA